MLRKKGFTIIEVLVASTLVAIVCSGAYALLVSTGRQSAYLREDRDISMILSSAENCLRSFGTTTICSIPINTTGSVNLGNNLEGCATGSYDTSGNYPGIIVQKIRGNPVASTTSSDYKAYYITTPGGCGETILRTIVEGESLKREGLQKFYP